MSKVLSFGLAAAVLAGSAGLASAQDRSPVFGGAETRTLSVTENKGVKAKGYYADLYGYYGLVDLANAKTYGEYAYYYAPSNSSTEYTYYYYAYASAASASNNFYYAYIYSLYGY
jgi:hypothetical protein